MLNMVALAENVAANGNSATVNFGASASTPPASRMMGGETAVVVFQASDAFDGTVAVEEALDGVTFTTQLAAVSLATGKGRTAVVKIQEYMRLVVAARTAGSVSAYILNAP